MTYLYTYNEIILLVDKKSEQYRLLLGWYKSFGNDVGNLSKPAFRLISPKI